MIKVYKIWYKGYYHEHEKPDRVYAAAHNKKRAAVLALLELSGEKVEDHREAWCWDWHFIIKEISCLGRPNKKVMPGFLTESEALIGFKPKTLQEYVAMYPEAETREMSSELKSALDNWRLEVMQCGKMIPDRSIGTRL